MDTTNPYGDCVPHEKIAYCLPIHVGRKNLNLMLAPMLKSKDPHIHELKSQTDLIVKPLSLLLESAQQTWGDINH